MPLLEPPPEPLPELLPELLPDLLLELLPLLVLPGATGAAPELPLLLPELVLVAKPELVPPEPEPTGCSDPPKPPDVCVGGLLHANPVSAQTSAVPIPCFISPKLKSRVPCRLSS